MTHNNTNLFGVGNDGNIVIERPYQKLKLFIATNFFNEFLNLNKIGTTGVPIALMSGHGTFKKKRND